MKKLLYVVGIYFLGLSSAWAGAVINYNGRIVTPTGVVLEAPQVVFKVSVYSPGPEKCLLYQEVRTINMVGSDGVFVIPIGDANAVRTGFDPSINMQAIFSNDPTNVINTALYPNLRCSLPAPYTPQLLDQRIMNVSFDDHSGAGEQLLPAMDIGFVPMALNAYNTQNFAGLGLTSFVSVASGVVTTPLSSAEYTTFRNLLQGSSARLDQMQTQIDGKASLTGASFSGAIAATGFFYTSDRRYKTHIRTYPDPLAKVLALRGTKFDWKADGSHDIGFIAQEVERVEPDLVKTQDVGTEHEHKSVKYGNITAIIIEGLKQFYAEFKTHSQKQDQEVQALKDEVAALKAEVESMKKQQAPPSQ